MTTANRLPISIPLSKKKIVLLFAGSATFVAIGFALLGNESFIKKTWATLCITFFGACGFYAFFKLFDRSPGLIIDDQGFTDYSSAAAVGRIAWKDVTELRVTRISGQKFLTIDVKNPDEYVARLGPLSSRLASANISLVNSPINISSSTLAINFDGLVTLMSMAHRAHSST